MDYYLYVIGNSNNIQKIGFSKYPEKRLKELQTGNSEQLFLHHSINCGSLKKVRDMEKRIHIELSYKRLKGEWFAMSKEDAINYVEFARITWLRTI